MGFFDQNDITKPSTKHTKTKTPRCCIDWFETLYPTLVRNRKAKQASKSKWLKDFTKLLDDLDGDDERIEKVLNWYCRNIRSPYTPQVYSASSFRTKFHQIEAAMKRCEKPTTKPTKTAYQIATRLGHEGWPVSCIDDLPSLVQISLNNWLGLIKKLRQFADEISDDVIQQGRRAPPLAERQMLARTASHLADVLAGNPTFVENWMRLVKYRLDNTINPFDEVLKVDHPRFQKYARQVIYEYCSDSRRFDKVMEYLNENPKAGRDARTSDSDSDDS